MLLSRVRLFGTPWTAACQASLSLTISRSLPKFMSIASVMPSNHLILCHPEWGRSYSEILELGGGGWSFSISDLGYPGGWTRVEYPTG